MKLIPCLFAAIFLTVFMCTDSLPLESASSQDYGTSGLGLSFKYLSSLEKKLGKVANGMSCTVCKIGIGLIQSYLNLESTETDIVNVLTKVCIDLKIEDVTVCTGITEEFKNEVLTVLDEAVVTPNDVCGTILGPSCANSGSAYGPWNVTFPKKTEPRGANAVVADQQRKVTPLTHLLINSYN